MIHIRRMTEADAAAVAHILRSLGWFEFLKDESFEESEARITRSIAQNLRDRSHSLFVAEEQDRGIVGYVAVHWLPYLLLKAPEGYVSELFVAESTRGKGLGAALLQKVRDEAQERGCSRLTLINVRTRESYQRQFYKKQGWTERPDDARFVLNLL